MLKFIIRAITGLALFTALAAGSCEQNGRIPVNTLLPYVPAQYRTCAERELSKFPSGTVSRAELVKLLADVRKDSVQFKGCAQGVIAWYDQVRKSYGKK